MSATKRVSAHNCSNKSVTKNLLRHGFKTNVNDALIRILKNDKVFTNIN